MDSSLKLNAALYRYASLLEFIKESFHDYSQNRRTLPSIARFKEKPIKERSHDKNVNYAKSVKE